MSLANLKASKLIDDSDLTEHLYNIKTRGYSLIHNFLNEDSCQVLKKTMCNSIEKYQPTKSSLRSFHDKYQIHDLINTDINYGYLLEDPRLQQLISPFLGDCWIMYAATSSSIPPGGVNYASRLHVDSPRFSKDYIFNMGLIWTLDDYTAENGALKILPGSQNCEKIPTLDFFEKNSTQIICKSGTLLVFNARTVHKTCVNESINWSHSMTLNACRSFMKQRIDWVRFIPEHISSKLNLQARRLIGFDTRLPTSLEEFFVPEEERLYKSNQG